MKERTAYINALLHQDPATQDREIRQLLLDLMDITEQSDLGERVSRAHRAFEALAVPTDLVWKLYGPHVSNRIFARVGVTRDEADKHVELRSSLAEKILQELLDEPVKI